MSETWPTVQFPLIWHCFTLFLISDLLTFSPQVHLFQCKPDYNDQSKFFQNRSLLSYFANHTFLNFSLPISCSIQIKLALMSFPVFLQLCKLFPLGKCEVCISLYSAPKAICLLWDAFPNSQTRLIITSFAITSFTNRINDDIAIILLHSALKFLIPRGYFYTSCQS